MPTTHISFRAMTYYGITKNRHHAPRLWPSTCDRGHAPRHAPRSVRVWYVFAHKFELDHDRDMWWVPTYSSRQDASNYMQHDILKILLDLDLRSTFDGDFPRLSPASPSVRPLRMWFDACLCLQNHTHMHPSDSFSLDSRDITLLCGCMPDSMFFSHHHPCRHPFSRQCGRHAARWPGTRRKWRHLRPIKRGDAFWIRLQVTLGITLDNGRFGKNMEYS